ncbi:MAG TPA: VCBS repeat-containing protein [bacterium]|nr:VCBS repeat-containing protein [bacterium]
MVHTTTTRKKTLLLSLLCILAVNVAGFCAESPNGIPPLVSGKPIPVGTADGWGLFSAGLSQEPIGAAYVLGSEQADLFVIGRGWYAGRKDRHNRLFLYPWVCSAENGTPVFGAPISIESPHTGAGTIFQAEDKTIHGVWIDGSMLAHTVFDVEKRTFSELEKVEISGLPRNPSEVAVLMNPDASVEVFLGIGDGVTFGPTDYGGRDPKYTPFDGAGLWRGGYPYEFLYAVSLPGLLKSPASEPRLVSKTMKEVRHSYCSLTMVNLGSEHSRDLVGGSRFGGLYYYRNPVAQGVNLEPKRFIVCADGNAHRHPIIDPSPVAYPNPKTRFSDLIAGGEGALYYYRFTGSFTEQGNPIYENPTPALREKADLYAGSLPVANVVDWDGDGSMDLVSGNSEGKVLFFRNAGSNEHPAFLPGEPITAGGQVIHIQPGYHMDIQGPGEARWGYTCPTVADWNENGLPDILMSDSTACHTVYLNRGTPTKPKLDFGHPIYYDGLDLYGTWRVKPAAAKMGDRMAYVALDEHDEFHLYWRVDDYNLEDGGKLHLDDGSAIRANFLAAGGTGRLKLNLFDWDRDGRTDLIVGTPRHGSVPNPKTGLPQSLGLPGSAVLFLKNVGTDSGPVFQFPVLFEFRGSPIFLGQHACGPTVADFGGPNGPDLIVGEETGGFMYYKRDDLKP